MPDMLLLELGLSVELLLDVLPVVPDALLELLGDVLLPELLELGDVLLPDPYEEELLPDDPIIALLSVQLPLDPSRQPVRVMREDELELLWSDMEPDVPVVVLLVPD